LQNTVDVAGAVVVLPHQLEGVECLKDNGFGRVSPRVAGIQIRSYCGLLRIAQTHKGAEYWRIRFAGCPAGELGLNRIFLP